MSKIQWTNRTWNPVVGCRRVSPGCENCYAETMAGRLARMGQRRYLDVVKVDEAGQPRGRWNGTFREVPEVLSAPLKWRKPQRIFVNSMSDLFGEGVSDEWIAACFGVMAACSQHTFQILTKRPERMVQWFVDYSTAGGFDECIAQAIARVPDYFRRFDRTWPLPNVWIGVSVENQAAADERIPHLLRCPAAVRFLSVEPLIGPIDLSMALEAFQPHDASLNRNPAPVAWVIVGTESGHGARRCSDDDVHGIVDQCAAAAAVSLFVKQMSSDAARRAGDPKGGDMRHWPEWARVRQWPNVAT